MDGQSQPLQRQRGAQTPDDWETLVCLPSTWSDLPLDPGIHTFPGTQHLALEDPNSFYANLYLSPREPEPFALHGDSVTQQAVSGPGMSSSEMVGKHCRFTLNSVADSEPPAADSFTGVDINVKLSAPRLNASLPLHRFHPYLKPGSNAQHHDTAGANQTSRNPIPSDLNLSMAGPSHRGIATPLPVPLPVPVPPPLPSRLGMGSLGILLLRTREHFTCEMLNRHDGFLMKGEILKSLARCSLETTFGRNNRKCPELLKIKC